MVLGEFSEAEKEAVFSDVKLRKNLINRIKKEVAEEINVLPELNSEDVIINLALEYFLECLENPDKEEDKGTFILGLEQVYLMANYDFIKDVVLK